MIEERRKIITDKEAIKLWKEHCEVVQASSFIPPFESEINKRKRIVRLLKHYDEFVEYYFNHWLYNEADETYTPSAPFHIKTANEIKSNKKLRAVYQWHRGAAKSTNLDVFIPMWLIAQGELNVMVLVGKNEVSACTLLADLQAELQYNQRFIDDFGVQYSAGEWTEGQVVTAQGKAFFARGRGQSPRGLRYRKHRPDYIVIDDLDDEELVKNPKRVAEMTAWIKEALFGTMDIGKGRFIMVGNLIDNNSVLANISKISNVKVSKVNILNNKGEPSWAERYTLEDIKDLQEFQGYRSFQREYMNNPITEGAVFKADWIKYKKPLPLNKYDRIIAYIDPSFKSSSKNDYKACQVWGKVGTELHNLRSFVRQCTILEMVTWLYNYYEETRSLAPILFMMEANFMQDLILDEIRKEGEMRGYQLPIQADRRKKPDKFQRIEAISPLWERGVVYYSEDLKEDPDHLRGKEQTLAFEKGSRAHDDSPDADEGAIYELQRFTRNNASEIRIGVRAKNRSMY